MEAKVSDARGGADVRGGKGQSLGAQPLKHRTREGGNAGLRRPLSGWPGALFCRFRSAEQAGSADFSLRTAPTLSENRLSLR